MVKFRCQRCSQKIAVNDEGRGVVIDCPTCADHLIVPTRTDREFLPHKAETVPLELVTEPDPVPRPSWPRLVLEKLLPALLAQRREMLQTQEVAVEQVAALEQRVVLLQMKFQRRLGYYQERIATLEAENRHLSHQTRTQSANVPSASFGSGRVNLRDASLLLRA